MELEAADDTALVLALRAGDARARSVRVIVRAVGRYASVRVRAVGETPPPSLAKAPISQDVALSSS